MWPVLKFRIKNLLQDFLRKLPKVIILYYGLKVSTWYFCIKPFKIYKFCFHMSEQNFLKSGKKEVLMLNQTTSIGAIMF